MSPARSFLESRPVLPPGGICPNGGILRIGKGRANGTTRDTPLAPPRFLPVLYLSTVLPLCRPIELTGVARLRIAISTGPNMGEAVSIFPMREGARVVRPNSPRWDRNSLDI